MGSSLYNDELLQLALYYVDRAKTSGIKISFNVNIRPEIIQNDTKNQIV